MTGDVSELAALLERRVAEAAALRWEDLPPRVREHVGHVVADTVGVVAAGARSTEVRALAADPDLGLLPAGAARSR